MMKQLLVPLITHLDKTSAIEQVSSLLDNMENQAIDLAPWPEFPYIPEVFFSIAHGNDCMFVKYYVTEAVVRAAWFRSNDPVYKDSCVECFIAFEEEQAYYNFEFNALGACKLNFGVDRNARIVIDERNVSALRFSTIIKNLSEDKGVYWEFTLIIPLEAFSEHNFTSLSGKKARANFYKCGDELPTPHFLCWNNIKTKTPDFHSPGYFGELTFL